MFIATAGACCQLVFNRKYETTVFTLSGCLRHLDVYLGSENITSLDIFGTHVASIGSTEDEASSKDDIEVIERTSGKNYYRLIVSRGRLIGAQSIGDARDMGALLCAMIRWDDLNEIKWEASRIDLLPLNPWYYRVARLWWL